MSRTNEARHIKWHEMCKCKCRLNARFVIINNVGIMINAIKDMLGILVIVSVSVINHVILVSI